MRICLASVWFVFAGLVTSLPAEETLSVKTTGPAPVPAYSAEFVQEKVAASVNGDPKRGALVFSSQKFACISCHKVGNHGGQIGPNLSEVGKKKSPEHLVESLFWPKRHVEKEFISHRVVTTDGQILQGYLHEENVELLTLRDPATGKLTVIPANEIDERATVETLMPDGLTAGMNAFQQADLFSFLRTLGRPEGLSVSACDEIFRVVTAHGHGPVKFDYTLAPLHSQNWPHSQKEINRMRLYDFYEKQADHFRQLSPPPPLLAEFPGLEGSVATNEFRKVAKEIDPRWNETDISPVLAGTFRDGKIEIPKGICVRLGDKGEMGVCFDPETLNYVVLWEGPFLKFPGERRGFMDSLKPAGNVLPPPQQNAPNKNAVYHGYYRCGQRILFSYSIDGTEFLDSPWEEDGKFQRIVGPASTHPLRNLTGGGTALWGEEITCPIEFGTNRPYAVDTIHLPFQNPRHDLMFGSGVAFLPDGAALYCTIQGDVWRAEGYQYPSKEVRWRKVASGMYQALGIVADQDGVFVLGRDQITRLHDLNGDGEYDFHECFCSSYLTSTFGHDYICGLERDQAGNFYTASSKQGLLQISPDGKTVTTIATGFRNPGGVGVMADGTPLVPCSQGNWTPASMICAVRPPFVTGKIDQAPPYYGYGGPQNGQPPALPLVYLPRGLDNSSGGQATVSSDRWGPLKDHSLHFSFGACRYFLMLRDEVNGQFQGGVVPMTGDFRSGVQRGTFSPHDGQLYVAGQSGWGTFAVEDGCFERVRYTGDPVQLPIGFHAYSNGIRVDFSASIDSQLATDVVKQFAQCWNYRYSAAYGSPEFAPSFPGTPGHETLNIRGAHLVSGGNSLFLEIPELQPVNQLHLHLQVNPGETQDLYLTVHQLDDSFTEFPGYRATPKEVRPHPIFADLSFESKRVPNPWGKKIEGAREINISTSGNLKFDQQDLAITAGEAIQLTFKNADVVPHNWALVKPGKLEAVGELSNQFASDPDAYPRQYIPETSDIVAYVDVVEPGKYSTIYFKVPDQPGKYPFVCTFPGHWTVMSGYLTVQPK